MTPDHRHSDHFHTARVLLSTTRLQTGSQGQVHLRTTRGRWRGTEAAAHLDADPVVHAQPEEQQGAQEHRLEEVVQHPREPAVHQEGQGEERVCKAQAEELRKAASSTGEGTALRAALFSKTPKSPRTDCASDRDRTPSAPATRTAQRAWESRGCSSGRGDEGQTAVPAPSAKCREGRVRSPSRF